MLSKERQQDYFRDRWESVFHHFTQFSRHTNADDIHKIRVDLKKIRMMLYLEDKIHGKKHNAVRKLILRLFRLAGTIREAQIAAQLVKQAKSGSVEYFTQHRNEVAKASKAFVQAVNRNTDRLVETNSELWKSFRAIKASELEKLTQKLMEKIKPVVYPVIKKRSLHESRKLMKRLIYIHALLKRKDAVRLVPMIDALRGLEQEIGEWHDAEVTIQLMRKFPRASKIKARLKQRADLHLKRVRTKAHILFGKNKKGGKISRLRSVYQ